MFTSRGLVFDQNIMKYQEVSLANITFSNDKQSQLELHSFFNVINIINLQLSVLAMQLDAEDQLSWIIDQTLVLAEKVKQGDSSILYPNHIDQYSTMILTELEKLEHGTDNNAMIAIAEAKALFNELFGVAKTRSAELLAKMLNPGKWEAHNVDAYKDEFQTFFMAVEKNSKGRYRIIYNIARQEEMDYLVQLDIESEFGKYIYMPLSFKDIIRDLVANARKYTSPGGQIVIGIYQNKNELRFLVQDNGIGIPEDELDKVFEFGYRGSNVSEKPTMGGGFGLTKAAYIVKQLNGRIFIGSKEGEGTRIRIEVPIPANVLHEIESHV
jgi:signal transduction histidine kinase